MEERFFKQPILKYSYEYPSTHWELDESGQPTSVTSWRDVLTQTIETLADLELEAFETLTQEYPRLISPDVNRFRRNRKLQNGFYIEVNLSAKDIYRFYTQAIETVGLSSQDWVVE